jgi:hypothetical protein
MRSRLSAIFLSVAAAALTTTSGTAGQNPVPSPFRGAFDVIATPAADGAAEPNLATDAKGRVWLTWLEPVAGIGHRFQMSSLAGRQWSKPVTIAEGRLLANWADFPSLFVSSDGTMAAHWLDSGAGKPYGIRVRTSRDAGRTWTPATTPHKDTAAGEFGFVSFYDAPGGGVGMVWLDGRNAGGHGAEGHGAMALRSTLLKNGASGEQAIVDARVCECCQTSAARAGDAVLVVYRDRSDKEIRDTSIVRFAGGKWSAPATVHADNWEISSCPVNGPVVTANGNGAAVAWFTGAGGTWATKLAFSSDAGKSFGAPIHFNAGAAGETLGRLAMVMPSADRVLVTSLERTASGAHLVLRDVRKDGRVSAPVEIAPATPARSGGFARLARSGTKVIVAWTEVRQGSPSAVRTAVAEMR